MGTVRRICRNVKRWRDASMALRWTAAAMQEAVKGFRRLKAYRQLPLLRAPSLLTRASTHLTPRLNPMPVPLSFATWQPLAPPISTASGTSPRQGGSRRLDTERLEVIPVQYRVIGLSGYRVIVTKAAKIRLPVLCHYRGAGAGGLHSVLPPLRVQVAVRKCLRVAPPS
jgi:hypothetical protein